ncbi:hypothetical protein C5Y96_14480 [Blastopirellula marina]|uniref:Uncharacterized protein n=1 Tax=Blastopirellula marina TaxID=124 RepID=A0A2S8FES1_9BACT|nr:MULTISPECIES: hypothetical protein [Pirellulaceae]PQO30668.1 hypothetical protein C5Y96_14480 [Blastopirellula marina]RCS50805.1 hypothetical protein DTL36_14490 [Bremerella cremea]
MTVFYIVIAVLVLLFGIFSYLNAANWNVLHVLGLFLTFGAAFAYLVLAAAVLRTESSWKKLAEQREKELSLAVSQVELLETGQTVNPQTGRLETVDNATDSLLGAKAELKRVMYDRGRLWRNVTRGAVNNNQVGLTLAPVQVPATNNPAGGAAPAPVSTQRSLAPDDIVYAFGQMSHPTDPTVTVPAYFIGEFVVRTIQDQNMTVESTTKLDRAQQQTLNLPNQWMLYDKMPVDDNEVFDNMDDAELATLIRGACSRMGLPQPMQDEVLASIQRNGEPASTDDPEIAVMSKVTFQQDHEIQVDAQTDTANITQEFEPQTGLAAASFLKQGQPTKFSKGDQVILSTSRNPGKALVDQGIITVDEQVYIRPLNDFAFQFHAYNSQVEDMRDMAYTLTEDIKMLTEADGIAKDIIAYREQEKTKLQDDKTKVVYEQEQIAEYKQKLLTFLTETLKINSQLYRTNQTLVEELQRASDAVLRKLGQEELDKADPDSLTLAF